MIFLKNAFNMVVAKLNFVKTKMSLPLSQGIPAENGNAFSNVAAMTVRNMSEPFKLSGVEIDGISTQDARKGDEVSLWTRGVIDSDDGLFHRIIDGFDRIVRFHLQKIGVFMGLDKAHSALLLIHGDKSADLWINSVAISMNVVTRRSLEAGQPVSLNDIADVLSVSFPAIAFEPDDQVVYLFREAWRFGLFFDFNPGRKLDVKSIESSLGAVHRKLQYHHLYTAINDKNIVENLFKSGWFPFVELIRGDFDELIPPARAGFELSEVEKLILSRFDELRVEHMFTRWMTKRALRDKEPLLRSAVNAFKTNDPFACLKIVLTELEGIIVSAHREKHGVGAKQKRMIEFAVESAVNRVGGDGTLFFPRQFGTYLTEYTFASFDPTLPDSAAGSRHSVGHGAMKAEDYTQVRALQSILTLDQIAFYLE